jgi:hypothetical protein
VPETVLDTNGSILYKLTGGDISKTILVENICVETCYDWYYLIRVKELNQMKLRIAEQNEVK